MLCGGGCLLKVFAEPLVVRLVRDFGSLLLPDLLKPWVVVAVRGLAGRPYLNAL